MQKFLFLVFLKLVLAVDPNLPQHTLPVYGNASFGYYYVKVYVGHPPQEQSVIIDTGSGQLALPCNKCPSCNPNHINKPFDMSVSKTAQYLTCDSNSAQCRRCTNKNPTQSCRFVISYAEGSSLEGVIIKDSIQFQSFSQGQQIVTSFGCTTKQTNLFLKQQANGIFGLSPERTSSLLQDMYQKHHGFSGQQLEFSLCLTGNGGLMNIGKVNEALHLNKKSIKTTYSSQRNLYSLNRVGQIKVGNSIIHQQDQKYGLYGIFIDSGSTFTYFPYKNYLIFRQQLTKSCSKRHQICQVAQGQSTFCFHLKGQNDILQAMQQIFPPVIFNIAQQQLKWKPEKYFLLRDIKNRQICLGVQSLDRYLLGANWMVDKDIVFNIKEKTIQIFQDSNCLGQQSQRRYMSQYSQQIEGHKPLNYQSGSQVSKHSDSFIIFGTVLICMGFGGIIMFILINYDKKKLKKHNPLRSVETEDDLQMIPKEQNRRGPQL